MKEELNKYLDVLLKWENPLFYPLLIVFIILTCIFFFYHSIFLPNKKQHEREKLEAQLKASQLIMEKYKTFALRVQEKAEGEKQRLGRELHDSIGQNLYLIRMKMISLQQAGDLVNVIDSTIKDLKEIIYDLKPRALEEMGLPPAVLNLCERIKNTSCISGSVLVTGTIRHLGPEKELYLYRALQECINNIIRHSGARDYLIRFIYGDENLRIITVDEGKGMDVETARNGKGNGLFNIEERIKHLGGTTSITSSPQQGTVIMMEVPYAS